ncbi:hypothetical protein ACRWQN_14980 [Shewanella sp. HL-SH8]|uniref:hypothetical protein n=1 Tax=Shewanella sp. HL-SH8 TaxID=3436242 RepID=UPI003EBC3583
MTVGGSITAMTVGGCVIDMTIGGSITGMTVGGRYRDDGSWCIGCMTADAVLPI